jgi:DNA-binding winged helix-turn-helix (wHTH) protein/TolB-like protein/Tfp pilus assembly protein PilF
MSHKTNPIYEFGPFRLDAKERLLLRAGEPVPLTPKAFDLLLALVERQGHLLAKDELMKRVWPETCVEESNLSYNISFIRKALGDGGNGQRYIETAPKHGYRFVSQVKEVEMNIAGVSSPSQPGAAMAVAVAPSEISAAPLPPMTAATEANSLPTASEDEKRSAFHTKGPSKLLGRRLATIGGVIAVLAAALAIYYFRNDHDAAAPPIRTIAILPSRALHPNERDEGLERGMTSTLITRLGALRQLIVRPESTVEKYAQPNQDPILAGREMKVDAVLDSRYQRSGDKIRFTLRLLRVTDEATLWADALDQHVADPFTIQDAISSQVTTALRLTLNADDKELLAKRYTRNGEAWRLYARGQHLLHKRSTADMEQSIVYFQQAIDLDQNFALAYAKLAFAYLSLSFYAAPREDLSLKAKAALDRAMKIDDRLAETHAYLGLYKRSYEFDFAGAEQSHKRAIELNPNSAEAHHVYAFYLTYLGNFEAGIREIIRAEYLAPTDQFVSRNVSQILLYARCYDEAIRQSERTLELDRKAGRAYIWRVRAYEMAGDEKGAFTAILKQAELEGARPEILDGMKAAFAKGGIKGYWKYKLDKFLETEKTAYVPHINIALVYAQLGQKEQALARLEKAVADRNHYVIALKVEPVYDILRSDPRFQALLKLAGLSP